MTKGWNARGWNFETRNVVLPNSWKVGAQCGFPGFPFCITPHTVQTTNARGDDRRLPPPLLVLY